MSPEEIATQLENAADYLEKYGWHQGDYAAGYENEDGVWVNSVEYEPSWFQDQRACALGALALGNAMTQWPGNERSTAVNAMEEYLFQHNLGSDIAEWNDQCASSAQEVLDMLRGAAKAVLTQEIVL